MTKNQKLGRYIVFEGLDSSGKSTQAEMLLDELRKIGQQCQFIAEPGGTEVGDKIRAILKDGSLERTPETNLDLFTICRREIIAQKLGPAVLAGIDVISDRNWWSSVAYQGFGEGVDVGLIKSRSEEAMGDYYMPDQMIFIDTPVDVVHKRMHLKGGSAEDYFEKKGPSFFKKVRQGYIALSQEFGVVPINGDQTPEKVHQDVMRQINKA